MPNPPVKIIPDAKIPYLKVYVGDPNLISSTDYSVLRGVKSVSFYEALGNTVGYVGDSPFDKIQGQEMVISKPVFREENTLLRDVQNNQDPNSDWRLAVIEEYKNVVGQDLSGGSYHVFRPVTSRGILPDKDAIPAPESAYSEVVSPSSPKTIKIYQASSDPWIWTGFVSSNNFIENPNFYFEFDFKDSGNINTKWWTNADLEEKKLCITLGYGTPYEFTITMGINYKKGSYLSCTYRDYEFFIDEGQDVIYPGFYGNVSIKLLWCPPGFYMFTASNMRKSYKIISPAASVVENPYTQNRNISPNGGIIELKKGRMSTYVPPAPIMISAYGVGPYTFGFSPVRFPKKISYYVQLKSLEEGEVFNPDNVEFKQALLLPSSNGVDEFILSQEIAEHTTPSGSRSIRVNVDIEVNDERKACYFSYYEYKIYDGLGDAQYQNELRQVTKTLKAINIKTSLPNILKPEFDGNIQFNNFNGEWDNCPPVQGIIIKQGWMEPSHMQLLSQGEDIDSVIREDDLNVIFRGYMINPSHTRNSYNEKFVSFTLKDRWFPLTVDRIENSPFFDGTSFLEALETLLRMAGYGKEGEEVIDLGPMARQELERYVIPATIASYLKPKYRFAFNTSYADAINTLMKLKRAVYYFSPHTGKLTILSFYDIFGLSGEAAQRYLFFSRIEDYLQYVSDLNLGQNTGGGSGGGDQPPEPVKHHSPYYILTKYSYDVDSESMRNLVTVVGHDWYGTTYKDASNISKVVMGKAYDSRSMLDSSYERYLGFRAPFYFSHTWITTDQECNYYARELLSRMSHPRETVTWTTPYFEFIPLYSEIVFKDHRGVIPEEKIFHLVERDFQYDSATLSLKASYRAMRLQTILNSSIPFTL